MLSKAAVEYHQNDEELHHQPQEKQEYDHLLWPEQVLAIHQLLEEDGRRRLVALG
jgi:hypothetical protein